MSNFLWLFFIAFSIFIISGCGTGQQKSEDKNAGEPKSEISSQLLKEHSDLNTKAGQEIHNINLKLTELNNKIKAYNEKGSKLSEAQKKEIDEIEKIRASINPRIHDINNVSQEQWETFKASFEKDIEEVKSRIDILINELK
jgi:chromosome segregation ATPase